VYDRCGHREARLKEFNEWKERVFEKNKKAAESTKTFHMEVKTSDSKKRMISGFASTRFEDRSRDIVEPEALKRSMDIYLSNPIVLLNHDMDRPIGTMVDYTVTEDGLFVRDQIGSGFPDADEAWKKIEQGILRALSIGFIPRDTEWQGDNFVIKDLELVEHSVVAIPANRESLFSMEKAFLKGTDLIPVEKSDPLYVATKEVERHLKTIEDLYSLGSTSDKILIDGIKRRFDSLYEADDYGSLLKEISELERAIRE